MKKVAILQPNYIPWKGVFDLIHRVDTFVFLEDVKYTQQDWRNRNKIMTQDGPKWLIVPVKNSNREGQLIFETEIDKKVNWQRKHFNAFQLNYGRAPFFKQYKWILESIYLDKQWENISELNIYCTKLFAKELGINTEFVSSLDLKAEGTKDDRVLDICKKLEAEYYLSGPAAKDYIIPEKFQQNNIILDYINYEYPEYNQLHNPFNHYVTVLDLIFNCGPEAGNYIWGSQFDTLNK